MLGGKRKENSDKCNLYHEGHPGPSFLVDISKSGGPALWTPQREAPGDG